MLHAPSTDEGPEAGRVAARGHRRRRQAQTPGSEPQMPNFLGPQVIAGQGRPSRPVLGPFWESGRRPVLLCPQTWLPLNWALLAHWAGSGCQLCLFMCHPGMGMGSKAPRGGQ